MRVAYHDACHLAHAQQIRSQPRELLESIPGLELLEVGAERELCCGSAGIYNLVQPEAAAELGRRKAGHLIATGAQAIAAGNPGCTVAARPAPARARSSAAHPPPGRAAWRLDPGGRMSIEVTAASAPERQAVLADEPLEFLTGCTAASSPARRELLAARVRRAGRGSTRASARLPARDAGGPRRRDWRVAQAPADLADRRVEITGPTDAQDGDQRPQLRRERLHGRLRGRQLAHLGQRDRRPGQPQRRDRRHDRVDAPEEQDLPTERRDRHAAGAPARLAPAGAPHPGRRRADRRRAVRLRPFVFRNAQRAAERGSGPYFYLPKLESHREARLWNEVFTFAEDAPGPAAGHDQGHRADRDDPRRVRDGRDPLRAARALRGPERRAAGTTSSAPIK